MLWIFLCSCALFAEPIQERYLDKTAVRALATHLGIPEDEDLIQATQARWLRGQSLERWEMARIDHRLSEDIIQWGKEQGIYAPWRPKLIYYDKAVILGATTERMLSRLNYLVSLWNEGIRFDELIFLTGERSLDKQVDNYLEAKTETGAAGLIYRDAMLPSDMREIPMRVISAEKSSGRRATTRDTILLYSREKSHTALFVSCQPFCGYQYAIIKDTLVDTIDFDVVGEGRNPHSHSLAASVTLDSVARWLYQSQYIPVPVQLP